jgi:hypothetical protein
MRRRSHLPHSVRPSKVFEAYWRFAAERQEIFFRRLSGTEPPWTTDAVLQAYRFTNVYRASDRVRDWVLRLVCTNTHASIRMIAAALQGPRQHRNQLVWE